MHTHGSLVWACAGVCVVCMSVSVSVSKWEGVCVFKCSNGEMEWQRQWLGQQAACLSEWKGAYEGLAAFLPH